MFPVFEEVLPIVLKHLLADSSRGCYDCFEKCHHSDFNPLDALTLAFFSQDPLYSFSPFLTSDAIWQKQIPQHYVPLLRSIARKITGGYVNILDMEERLLWVVIARNHLRKLDLSNLRRKHQPLQFLHVIKYGRSTLESLALPPLVGYDSYHLRDTITECLMPSRDTLHDLNIELSGHAITQGLRDIGFSNLKTLTVRKPCNDRGPPGERTLWNYEVEYLLQSAIMNGSYPHTVIFLQLSYHCVFLPHLALYAPSVTTVTLEMDSERAVSSIMSQGLTVLQPCFANATHVEFRGVNSLNVTASWKQRGVFPSLQTLGVLTNGKATYKFDIVNSIQEVAPYMTKLEMCTPGKLWLTQGYLEPALYHCRKLKYLDLHMVTNQLQSVGNYLKRARRLKELRIEFYSLVYEDDIYQFGNFIVDCLLEAGCKFQRLNLKGLMVSHLLAKKLLVQCGSELRCFKIDVVSEIIDSSKYRFELRDEDMRDVCDAVTRNCCNLEYLHLWGLDGEVYGDNGKMTRVSPAYVESLRKAYRLLPNLRDMTSRVE